MVALPFKGWSPWSITYTTCVQHLCRRQKPGPGFGISLGWNNIVSPSFAASYFGLWSLLGASCHSAKINAWGFFFFFFMTCSQKNLLNFIDSENYAFVFKRHPRWTSSSFYIYCENKRKVKSELSPRSHPQVAADFLLWHIPEAIRCILSLSSPPLFFSNTTQMCVKSSTPKGFQQPFTVTVRNHGDPPPRWGCVWNPISPRQWSEA